MPLLVGSWHLLLWRKYFHVSLRVHVFFDVFNSLPSLCWLQEYVLKCWQTAQKKNTNSFTLLPNTIYLFVLFHTSALHLEKLTFTRRPNELILSNPVEKFPKHFHCLPPRNDQTFQEFSISKVRRTTSFFQSFADFEDTYINYFLRLRNWPIEAGPASEWLGKPRAV